MNRAQHGRASRLSRRRVLTIAATVGAGVSAAGVAGLSLAGETKKASSSSTAPLVISLRDAKKGTFDVFAGEQRLTLTDRTLAAHLLKAVHRS